MLKSLNVATPLAAGCGIVPDSVPPPALIWIATVTLPVDPVATLPNASNAVTVTAGAIATPAVAFVGSTEKASWLAAAGPTVKALDTSPETPPAAAARSEERRVGKECRSRWSPDH